MAQLHRARCQQGPGEGASAPGAWGRAWAVGCAPQQGPCLVQSGAVLPGTLPTEQQAGGQTANTPHFLAAQGPGWKQSLFYSAETTHFASPCPAGSGGGCRGVAGQLLHSAVTSKARPSEARPSTTHTPQVSGGKDLLRWRTPGALRGTRTWARPGTPGATGPPFMGCSVTQLLLLPLKVPSQGGDSEDPEVMSAEGVGRARWSRPGGAGREPSRPSSLEATWASLHLLCTLHACGLGGWTGA